MTRVRLASVAGRIDARIALLETFVAIYDDDPGLTLETDLLEAILHLPSGQQAEARILLKDADLDSVSFRLKDLFHKDPYTY